MVGPEFIAHIQFASLPLTKSFTYPAKAIGFLSSGGYIYYTVVLKSSGDMLSGFYSSSVPFDPADQAAVTLRQIGN